MKNAILILSLLVHSSLMSQTFFVEADRFFSQNVQGGLVNYSQIKNDPGSLNLLVRQIGGYDLKSATDQELKAFYINTYNLLVIHQIIKHYPIEGPLKIPGFFDKQKFKISEDYLTLDQLEKELLFKKFPDPRLHFVLVCAAMGCPPLADFAFLPELIEKQLEDRTTYVLNFHDFILVNSNEVQASKIFEWYAVDFVNKSHSILSYIDRYHTEDLKGKKLTFYEYNWTLNRH